MTRAEAAAILKLPPDKAIKAILALADKAEKYDQLIGGVSPTTPSGMTPPYLKPTAGERKKPPGRKNGHPGTGRFRPQQVDHFKEHTLSCCPDCQNPLKNPVKAYTRYVEDIPRIEKPEVTSHTLYGYWCSRCQKVVFPTLADALPNAMIGLRLLVLTAWLHYLIGVSVNNIVKILSVVCRFKISAGGLTQAWVNLAELLEPAYNHIGERISQSGVLSADETGWRLNGITHWLWCFTTKTLCYYLITKSRGSPVIRQVLGSVFRGILICDFWGAYNKITALAKQRCFYHLFTELAKVDKANRFANWKAFRKRLLRLLKDAIRLSQRRSQLETKKYNNLKSRLYCRLEQILSANHNEDKDVKRLLKRLKRHKDELFTFLEHEHVSPYNNHAEQQMRKPVLVRKVSQQNRSEQGAKTQAILMSLFRTAELQGKNPLEMVRSLATSALDNSAATDDLLDLAA